MFATRTFLLVALCALPMFACNEAVSNSPVVPAPDASAADVGGPELDAPVAADMPVAVDAPIAVDTPTAVDASVALDAGRSAGAACAQDADCADGWCADLPSGYCSRRRCDMNSCPAGTECNYLVRTGLPSIYICLRACNAASECRAADGYTCNRGHCVEGPRDAGTPLDVGTRDTGTPADVGARDVGTPVDLGPRCSSIVGRDCPVGQACAPSGHCTTSCSFDWRCNGGCCNGGRCAAGAELRACGTSSTTAWRCGDCSSGCTSGAACRAVTGGGACACSSCTPIGGSCSSSTGCCSRSCAGLNGNLRCQ